MVSTSLVYVSLLFLGLAEGRVSLTYQVTSIAADSCAPTCPPTNQATSYAQLYSCIADSERDYPQCTFDGFFEATGDLALQCQSPQGDSQYFDLDVMDLHDPEALVYYEGTWTGHIKVDFATAATSECQFQVCGVTEDLNTKCGITSEGCLAGGATLNLGANSLEYTYTDLYAMEGLVSDQPKNACGGSVTKASISNMRYTFHFAVPDAQESTENGAIVTMSLPALVFFTLVSLLH